MKSMEVIELLIERIDSNSEAYTVSEIFVTHGALVELCQVVAIIETIKTVFEVESPASGRLFFGPGIQSGCKVNVGQLLAVVAPSTATEQDVSGLLKIHASVPETSPAVRGVTFSRQALLKLQELGMAADAFEGRGLVTGGEVEAMFNATRRAE